MVQPTSRKSFPVSWDQFHRDARALAWRLADKGPFDAIVCITRGGLVPAAIVARELELKLVETVCVASYHDYAHQAGGGSDVPHVRDRGIAGHLDLLSLGHGPAICGAHQRRRAAGAPELNCRGVWGLEHLIAV